ncbi:cell wall metabolism sensor histidine kinase WalK [Nocardioides sp. CFH 31398]|uniref:sensor histidine kinase n=1 Tax=Nocardioides sp. CFH 31398 TaxID=2919579 RepID=UPI001F06A906|nr:HAMP domain-containing sensor histidine kinase [Nocardioides sp. CFH 31398]MCH1866587.1 HAMP domain-containing histidine kinase [Nocardioides sp. CFH 31398]
MAPVLRRPVSLTARLVLTVVALTVVVTVVAGGVTSVAVGRFLHDRLDNEVRAELARVTLSPDGSRLSPGDGDGDELGPPPGQPVGTVTAQLPGDASGGEGSVLLQRDPGEAANVPLSEADLAVLARVPDDGDLHDVDLPVLGEYRVAAVPAESGDAASFVTGLPTEPVHEVVRTMVLWELLLLVLSAVAAWLGGRFLVRRQLRPLREVAATADDVARLPLATDEVDLHDRVPGHLRDERTEVGRVGDALANLLSHVGTSFAARRRVEEQIRRFVADASHELRTPLTTIGGYVQLARRRPDDREATATALTKVEEESARMTALVEDLLLLARLDSGRPLERREVDVTKLMLEAVADARVVGADHRWRLDVPDDALVVVGDPLRLHQVVTNLLTNARKYTPAGSTVTARAAQRDGAVVLAVHDDGPGFDDDAAAHAFERFARGDPARVRAGGVGLGLALVEAIVVAHGGAAHLESRPGDTTVSVTLPVGVSVPGPATTVDA